VIRRYFDQVVDALARRVAQRLKDARDAQSRSFGERTLQILLVSRFKEIASGKTPMLSFRDVEFSAYSQNGEDGILLYIFTLIGTTNRKVAEVCAGDGIECNAANLIINHGWTGLLVDGNSKAIERGARFYATRTNAWRLNRLSPTLVHAWVDRNNINELLTRNHMSGEIDLLSLDMDGIDFWIWEALECISPRVVVLEYNNRWRADDAVTVPYSDRFVGVGVSVEGQGYFGASLLAYVRLASRKGYRLIGVNSPNTNAVFMRNDVGSSVFPQVGVEECLSSPYAIYQNRTKLSLIKELPWIEVKESDVSPENDGSRN
jgi:hypothetical protein